MDISQVRFEDFNVLSFQIGYAQGCIDVICEYAGLNNEESLSAFFGWLSDSGILEDMEKIELQEEIRQGEDVYERISANWPEEWSTRPNPLKGFGIKLKKIIEIGSRQELVKKELERIMGKNSDCDCHALVAQSIMQMEYKE